MANQLFPDRNEIINYFKKNVDFSKEKKFTSETLNEVFDNDDILKDNVTTYINNYTKESFYYRYLNIFLREILKLFEFYQII